MIRNITADVLKRDENSFRVLFCEEFCNKIHDVAKQNVFNKMK